VLLDHIKIMMVTTESSMEKVQQALEAGANEYLMKPFTKDVLLEKLTLLGMA
jgi:two-component system chemotaxis response regulator CheY